MITEEQFSSVALLQRTVSSIGRLGDSSLAKDICW